ncbi:biotin/lipoyl-binding protein [Pseudobowmanella zhangzhouensis]|uniref:biotin/lipoyl-binding protein n=1 Tax=Pseudobowmanella zhangzhouensis TaxID=1537679 RepID=UPI00361FCF87
MKKWFVVVVILVIAAVFYWQRPQPVAVTTVNVTRASISEKVTNTRAGSVMACQRSKLSVPIGGQVVDIFVKEGDMVSQGQLLLSLFNQDIQALLTQAEASASAATLNRQSQCILADADQREANRQAKLKKSGLSTAEMVDMSESKARASEAACAASKAAEQVAQASIELQQASLSKTQLYAPLPAS